ncbi:MAG: NACHT domain-containing protein [Bacteroidota bacterium]|nr:NACHT domain-containing protein [Bacteroidota bacterium]
MLSGIIDKLFKLKKPFDLILSYLDQAANNKLLEYKVEEYNRTRFTKTFLFRHEPVDLLAIFQPIDVIKFTSFGRPTFRIAAKTASKFLDENRKILLIGGPGTGKSTIMKLLYITIYQSKEAYPIKIELRKLNLFKGNFIEYLFAEIFDFHKLAVNKLITNQLFYNKKFIFLIDGYDELNQDIRPRVLEELDAFIKKYPHHQYCVTSRQYTNINSLDGFQSFSISKMNLKEILGFTKRHLKRMNNIRLNYDIKSISYYIAHNYNANTNLREFIDSPLLLSMFLLMYDYNKDVPLKKSGFYFHAYETIAYLHDNQKWEFQRTWVSGFSRQEMLNFLCVFSANTYFTGQVSFSELEMLKQISVASSSGKVEKIIEDLLVSLGLFVKEGTFYYYSHKTFQEFFTALHISNQPEDAKIKVYERLSRPEKFAGNLFQHFNVLEILTELDQDNFIINFGIPYLKQIFADANKIKNPEDSYEKNLMIMYTLVRRLLDNLIHLEENQPDLYTKYLAVFYEDMANNFAVDENGIFALVGMVEDNYNRLADHLLILKGNLDDLCEVLLSSCTKQQAAKRGFINLI